MSDPTFPPDQKETVKLSGVPADALTNIIKTSTNNLHDAIQLMIILGGKLETPKDVEKYSDMMNLFQTPECVSRIYWKVTVDLLKSRDELGNIKIPPKQMENARHLKLTLKNYPYFVRMSGKDFVVSTGIVSYVKRNEYDTHPLKNDLIETRNGGYTLRDDYFESHSPDILKKLSVFKNLRSLIIHLDNSSAGSKIICPIGIPFIIPVIGVYVVRNKTDRLDEVMKLISKPVELNYTYLKSIEITNIPLIERSIPFPDQLIDSNEELRYTLHDMSLISSLELFEISGEYMKGNMGGVDSHPPLTQNYILPNHQESESRLSVVFRPIVQADICNILLPIDKRIPYHLKKLTVCPFSRQQNENRIQYGLCIYSHSINYCKTLELVNVSLTSMIYSKNNPVYQTIDITNSTQTEPYHADNIIYTKKIETLVITNVTFGNVIYGYEINHIICNDTKLSLTAYLMLRVHGDNPTTLNDLIMLGWLSFKHLKSVTYYKGILGDRAIENLKKNGVKLIELIPDEYVVKGKEKKIETKYSTHIVVQDDIDKMIDETDMVDLTNALFGK